VVFRPPPACHGGVTKSQTIQLYGHLRVAHPTIGISASQAPFIISPRSTTPDGSLFTLSGDEPHIYASLVPVVKSCSNRLPTTTRRYTPQRTTMSTLVGEPTNQVSDVSSFGSHGHHPWPTSRHCFDLMQNPLLIHRLPTLQTTHLFSAPIIGNTLITSIHYKGIRVALVSDHS